MVILLRGEALRVGENQNHEVTQDLQVFEKNMCSIKTYLIDPLEEMGYRTVLLADLMTDKFRNEETKETLKTVFEKHLAGERTTQWLRGTKQVHSVTSSWDWFLDWMEKDVEGRNTLEAWVCLV